MVERKIQKYSPRSNEMLYEVTVASEEEIESICVKAEDAFLHWRETSISQRKRILTQFMNAIKENQNVIVDSIIKDTAKAKCEAETEVIESCDIIEYYIKEEFEGIDSPVDIGIDEEIWTYKKVKKIYQPCGVYAVIKPWNYPFELPIWAIAPLLLTGNSIVFKPSEMSSATGILLAELINKTDIPDGVFNVILGDAQTGENLIKNSNISGISFTGSTSTGQKIYQSGYNDFPKLSLEMGGSDYAIICNDANIDITCKGILWGAFSNAGQVCVSTEKMLINEKIYFEFIKKMVEETKKLKIGSDVSPMISKEQLSNAMNIIDFAIQNGCKILCGGSKVNEQEYENGNYLYPTIIECNNKDLLLQLPEIFAPIVFVTPYRKDTDAIRHINESTFNLGCSIWTEIPKKHNELIQNLDVGMIWINEVNLPMPQAPWVGRKKSCVGLNLSKEAVYEAMNMKVIHIDEDVKEREWWYPYN